MVFLQVFVIGKLCQLCLLVEILVLLLFITSFRFSRVAYALFLLLVGFLTTHAMYTFPPDYTDPALVRAATWEGKGAYTVKFFFDPQCPACEKAFEVMKSYRSDFASVEFRSVAIHKGSFEKALGFYLLCERGEDPWMAFEKIHSGSSVPFVAGGALAVKVRSLVDSNLHVLLGIGIDAVPVIMVEKGENRRVFVGYKELENFLAKNGGEEPPPLMMFHPMTEGVCTPKKECN